MMRRNRYKETLKSCFRNLFKKEEHRTEKCDLHQENFDSFCRCSQNRHRKKANFCKFPFDNFNNDNKLLSLSDIEEDKKVIIDYIGGHKRIQKYLYDIGIKKGDEIKLLSNNRGQCVIMAGDKRITLCFGMSKLIKVSPI